MSVERILYHAVKRTSTCSAAEGEDVEYVLLLTDHSDPHFFALNPIAVTPYQLGEGIAERAMDGSLIGAAGKIKFDFTLPRHFLCPSTTLGSPGKSNPVLTVYTAELNQREQRKVLYALSEKLSELSDEASVQETGGVCSISLRDYL